MDCDIPVQRESYKARNSIDIELEENSSRLLQKRRERLKTNKRYDKNLRYSPKSGFLSNFIKRFQKDEGGKRYFPKKYLDKKTRYNIPLMDGVEMDNISSSNRDSLYASESTAELINFKHSDLT